MLHVHQRSTFEKRASNTVAFLASFVVHVVVLMIAACIVFTAGKNSQGILFEADEGISQESGFDLASTVAIVPEVEVLPEEIATSTLQFNLNVNASLSSSSQASSNAEAEFVSTSENSGFGEIPGSSTLSSPMKKRGAAFFGAYAEGKRFIFVLDSSRSMLEDDRWTYACNQLIDSLNGLQPEQEFYVICFDIQTTYLFNNPPSRAKFFKADEKTLPRVKRWLRTHELGRATMPAEALQNALALEPDAIFLLSDGELQDNSVGMLRMINGFSSNYKQIPIHTVHLFSDQGRETLKLIARENSGTFTPVQNN